MADSDKELVGRELDAVVHAFVMGVVWDSNRCRVCGWTLADSADEGCVEGNCSERPTPTREIRADTPPRYSAYVDTAMKVVEKMRERGFRFEALSPRGTGWQVRCFPADDAPDSYRRFKDLLPVAICRASLFALDSVKGEQS